MSSPHSNPAPVASIDLAEIRRRFAGDSDLIREVARAFLDVLPELRGDVTRAADGGDVAELKRAAHRLKGALLDVGAFQAAELAGQIENAGVGLHQSVPMLLVLVEGAARDVEALLAPP